MKKPRQYHHGDLRSALIDASLALIEEKGVDALSLREAARVAKVSPAAPYHHFESRAELLAAIAAQGFERLARRMKDHLQDAPDDAYERLFRIGSSYVEFALNEPTYFRLMFRPHDHLPPPEDTAYDLLTQNIARIVSDEARRMEFVVLAWSTVHGVSQLLLDGPLASLPLDEKARVGRATPAALVELLRQGWGTKSASRSAKPK